jgi:two-component system chemotaxis response regulator CheB
MNHDIVVIGGSSGSIEPLLELAPQLPADLPASIFIVVHMPPGWQSSLPDLLSSRGPLPARHPFHAERFAPGHIYVAPTDNHLLLRANGLMEVVRGPRENGHRPAADALFRSAAAAFDSRVIGVVLSGYQDCGTAGMMSIKARGGLGVVQDPETAAVAEMPRSVLQRMSVDHTVTSAELPALLNQLVRLPAKHGGPLPEAIERLEGSKPGSPAMLSCPSCHGVLQEAHASGFDHFRCHVGHTFSLDSLVHAQDEDLERALWSAVRVLEESASLARRLAGGAIRDLRPRFLEKAETHAEQAKRIRNILLHGEGMSVDAE